MGSYGRVDEDLDEYEDDFIDRDDEIGGDEYEDEEAEEEDEREDEPVSEEAVKLLKYRQKLKERLRAKLRQENSGSSSNLRDHIRRPSMNNFGSFFGPSKPVIADRVIQQSKALLETRHLAAKASTSQSQNTSQSRSGGKKVIMPSTSGAVNGLSRQPSVKQVKSKLQLMKDTRDYSFLLSEDADIPKSNGDPAPSGPPINTYLKPDTSPVQVPAKTNGSTHSGSKVSNGFQHRKVSGTPHVISARTVPPRKPIAGSGNGVVSSDSRRQLEFRKQPETSKQRGSSIGSRPVRPSMANTVPPKKPLTAAGQKAPYGSLVKGTQTGSSNKGPPPTQKHVMSNGQRPSLDKSRTSVVGSYREHQRDDRQTSGSKMLKKDNTLASKNQFKRPREHSHQANLERDHARNHKPAGKSSVHNHSNGVRNEPMRLPNGARKEPMRHSNGVRKEPISKKRRAEDLEEEPMDAISAVRAMFRYNPSKYVDYSDDDADMEVGFDTIQEEELRSARIARQEDEEELAKIMEEERLEKLRKKAKMRKISQR